MQEPRRRASSGDRVRVNAYYGQRSETETASPFIARAKKRTSRLLVWIFDSLLILAILVAFVYSLLVRPSAKLSVSNDTFHSQAEYQVVVNKQLTTLKDRNKITFDEASLSSAIERSFPEVESVDIELPILGEQPIVHLKIGKPAFFIRSSGKDYLLSANGVAVGYKSDYPNIGKLVQITDKSGFEVNVGKPILSTDNINFLNTLLAELARSQVPIKELVLPNSPAEADLYTQDAAYYTKFYMGGDAIIQSGQYLAARNSFKSQPAPSQYLDVRVAGKIFYK